MFAVGRHRCGSGNVGEGVTTTIPDSHRDLLDLPVATLGTVDSEGRPQLTEVWFLAEDGQVKFSLNTARQKVRNLQSRPACSVLLLGLVNPYRYVEIRGDAVLEPDDEYVFADRVGAKYGADLRTNDSPVTDVSSSPSGRRASIPGAETGTTRGNDAFNASPTEACTGAGGSAIAVGLEISCPPGRGAASAR